jgi:threonine dehydrogenase-like Zn-dependent dehydrogenase
MVLLGINNSYREGYNFQQSLAPDKLIFKEIQLFGSNVFPITMYYKMVNFMVENKVSFATMVTDTFSLEEGNEAFERATKATSGKVIFTWA